VDHGTWDVSCKKEDLIISLSYLLPPCHEDTNTYENSHSRESLCG
jgi:hypothetical protein